MVGRSENLLLVFAKFPQTGLVKTRLSQKLGDSLTVQLYRAFLADLAPRLAKPALMGSYDIRWVYLPTDAKFPELIADLQRGETLALLHTSFVAYDKAGLAQQQIEQLAWASQNHYQRAVIISTDSPHLPQTYIPEAFDRLATHDVVIGPTEDGGYYLLGLQPNYPVLENVIMSTSHVALDILTVAQSLQLTTYCMPTLIDVDDILDLNALIQAIHQAEPNPCPITWSVLNEHHLVVNGGLFIQSV